MYVKDYPVTWDEAKLREVFSKYGPIGSIKTDVNVNQNNKPYAFICFDDPNNKEIGPVSAFKAVEDLHEKPFIEDGVEYKIYISKALKKDEREEEKKREKTRF